MRLTTRSIVVLARVASPSGRFRRRTKTAPRPTMKVGTPKTWRSDAAASCSLRKVSRGQPSSIASNTPAGSTPAPASDVAEHGALPQIERLVVTGREQGLVDSQELLRLAIPHDDAGLVRQQAGIAIRMLPDGRLILGDVGLIEREGDELNVPVGSIGQRGDHMLVGVAGVGAPVVPGNGKGDRSHDRFNAAGRPQIPPEGGAGCGSWTIRVLASPITLPMAMPATTSDAWWMLTWTRLHATTRASP